MLKHLLRGGSGIKGDSWVATLGDSNYSDEGYSVAVAPDGSVYVGGQTNYNLLLAKFSSSGTVQWQKMLSGKYSDYGYSVAVAQDGSVYVCGKTESGNHRETDLLLAKFSSSGTVQWQKTLGGISDEDSGNSVAVAPDGSVYVCGQTNSTDPEYSDLLLAKFSSSGTVQWQKTLGYSEWSDSGNSVAVAQDGSVYVCGTAKFDLFLAKFSSSGTVQWQKILNDNYSGGGKSVAVAPDGSVYVYGSFYTNNATRMDSFLVKFSSSGTVQWHKTLGYDYSDIIGYSVAVAPDGSFYISGYTMDSLLLAKFSSSGTVQWQKILSYKDDSGNSVAVAPDGSVYVCGFTVTHYRNLLLAKITDSIIEKDTVTFGNLTFQDTLFAVKNVSSTETSSSLSVSNASLTLKTSSLTVGTPSLTTNLYTYKE